MTAESHSRFSTRSALAAAVAVCAVALTGCLTVSPKDNESDDAVPAEVEAPSRSMPLDVANEVVTHVDGRVTTTCFSANTPAGMEYELSPNATACLADVGWLDGDTLTQISLRAQVGDASHEAFTSYIENSGLPILGQEVITVDGVDSWLAHVEDGYGFRTTIIVVPLPEGRFTHDGKDLTSIFVSAYTYNSELEALLMELVGSLEIAD